MRDTSFIFKMTHLIPDAKAPSDQSNILDLNKDLIYIALFELKPVVALFIRLLMESRVTDQNVFISWTLFIFHDPLWRIL